MTGVPQRILPTLRSPSDILGALLPEIARDLGLDPGIPVLVGAGDYPMSLLGSGVTEVGMGSDVTGSSCIITQMNDGPNLTSQTTNVLSPNGIWGSMTLVDNGGDAVRWAKRTFHNNQYDYKQITKLAEESVPGSNGLFFLPYLNGERTTGSGSTRAQFFGLTAEHGMSDIHRAVLEGVAFSVRRSLDQLPHSFRRPEILFASGGGAKSEVWLQIKASMFNVPYIVPDELECGIVGAAMLMATSTAAFSDIAAAKKSMVHLGKTIEPDERWKEKFDTMMPIFNRIYNRSKSIYDELDAL